MAEARRRFKFLKEIAQGGFGKVYLAEMLTGDNFSSIVAIKLLHAKWTENAEVVMRSRDEARLLGRLRHRNIVRVESLTRIQSQVAIVMEYLEGADLKSVCGFLRDEGKIFPRQAAFEVVGLVAAALDAAYNQVPLNSNEPLRVIHRDIKPSNAMITVEGEVKVLDFGTARASFEHREAKTQALAFGSAAYMSPERLMGEEDTPQADVFSLGISLYELLTLDSFGKIPIRPEKFERVVEERLASVDLSTLSPEARDRTMSAMRRMLTYESKERATSAEVVEHMETLVDLVRDTGLKRFARETVTRVHAAQVPEVDPADPYTGGTALVYEDTSTIRDGATSSMTTTSDQWAADVSGPVLPESSDAKDATRPPDPVVTPLLPPRPPPPPAVHAVVPGSPPGTSGAKPFIPPAPQPPAPTTSAPKPSPQVSAPKAAAQTSGARAVGAKPPTTAPRPDASDPFDDSAPKRSGMGGIFAVVGVLGVLAVIGVVGVAVVVGGAASSGSGTEEATVDAPAPADHPNAALKPGDDVQNFDPNAAGSGGVVLMVPSGAAEVSVKNSTGFKVEWDGTKNLNLRDLEPGTMRTTVKPKGGGKSLLNDFEVVADKTCAYTFDAAGDGVWKEVECR